ncbi:hypothetical protein QP150_17080 [Sphingomonas sp. 22L2VL55-3]
MRTSLKVSLAAAVAVGALVALAPAIGQDRPESILPPGFGEPTPAPAPRPTPPAGTQAARPTDPAQPAAPAPAPAQPGAMTQPLPPTTPGDAPLVPLSRRLRRSIRPCSRSTRRRRPRGARSRR